MIRRHKSVFFVISSGFLLQLLIMWCCILGTNFISASSPNDLRSTGARLVSTDSSNQQSPAEQKAKNVAEYMQKIKVFRGDLSYLFDRIYDYAFSGDYDKIFNPYKPEYQIPLPLIACKRTSKNDATSKDTWSIMVSPYGKHELVFKGKQVFLDHMALMLGKHTSLFFKYFMYNEEAKKKAVELFEEIRRDTMNNHSLVRDLHDIPQITGYALEFITRLTGSWNLFEKDRLHNRRLLCQMRSEALGKIKHNPHLPPAERETAWREFHELNEIMCCRTIFVSLHYSLQIMQEVVTKKLVGTDCKFYYSLLSGCSDCSDHVKRELLISQENDGYTYEYYAVSISSWLLNFHALLLSFGDPCLEEHNNSLDLCWAIQQEVKNLQLLATVTNIGEAERLMNAGYTQKQSARKNGLLQRYKRDCKHISAKLKKNLTDKNRLHLLDIVYTRNNQTNPITRDEQKELQDVLDTFNAIRKMRIRGELLLEEAQLPPGKYALPACFKVPVEQADAFLEEIEAENSSAMHIRRKTKKQITRERIRLSASADLPDEESETEERVSSEMAETPDRSGALVPVEDEMPIGWEVDGEEVWETIRRVKKCSDTLENRSKDYLYDFQNGRQKEFEFDFCRSVSNWIYSKYWDEHRSFLITEKMKAGTYRTEITEKYLEVARLHHNIPEVMEMFYRGVPVLKKYFLAIGDGGKYGGRSFFALAHFIRVGMDGMQHESFGFAEMACAKYFRLDKIIYLVHHLRFRRRNSSNDDWVRSIPWQALVESTGNHHSGFKLIENDDSDGGTKIFCYCESGVNGPRVLKQLTIFPLSILTKETTEEVCAVIRDIVEKSARTDIEPSPYSWIPYRRMLQ